MRYFIYISDAKVDMLFPQVPGKTQHEVAAKFGFDIKLFSGSFQTKREAFSSLVARLQAVEDHIRSSEGVGAANSKSAWIAGESDAKLLDIGDGAILFLSHHNRLYLALGGSSGHLIGSSSPETVGIPYSFLSSLTSQLTRLAERDPEKLLKLPENFLKHYLAAGVSQEFDAWISVIRYAWDHSVGPTQRIEFLARRLVTSPSMLEECTLATPLYVALAE